MMRLLTTIMLLALLVFGLWSWVDYDYWLLGPSPAHYTWWWPEEFSTIGQEIDSLFYLIAVMVAVMFVITMGGLVLFTWKYSAMVPVQTATTHPCGQIRTPLGMAPEPERCKGCYSVLWTGISDEPGPSGNFRPICQAIIRNVNE